MADTVPPAGQQANINAPRRRPVWITILIGVIVICLVVSVMTAILAPPSTPTTSQPQATATPLAAAQANPTDTAPAQAPADTPVPVAPTDTSVPVPPTDTPKPPGIGDTQAVGSWKVTVEKVDKIKEFDWSGFGNMQTAKGIYAKVYATVENTTNKADSVKSFDWQVVDSQGAEYDACSEFGCFSGPEKEERVGFGSDIPPRTKGKMLAFFDVAEDAKGLTLVIESKTKFALGDLPDLP